MKHKNNINLTLSVSPPAPSGQDMLSTANKTVKQIMSKNILNKIQTKFPKKKCSQKSQKAPDNAGNVEMFLRHD